MKKMLVFLLIFVICGVIAAPNFYPLNILSAATVYYGRATNTSTFIYSTPFVLSDNTNAIFEIPSSYFVELLANENELFYKARYMDVIGYVKKAEMSCINTTPITPFANNITFRIFTPSGVNLRSSPYESLGVNNLIVSIPFMETNLLFFGNLDGEEAISYKGKNWYYCKYIKQNQSYFGYVYSPLCDLLTPIKTNTETFEYITPLFSDSELTPTSNAATILSFNTPTQIAIIIGVSLPCIAIIYFLFKPTKIAMQTASTKPKKQKSKPKKKIKQLKRSDYYELDDEFFS